MSKLFHQTRTLTHLSALLTSGHSAKHTDKRVSVVMFWSLPQPTELNTTYNTVHYARPDRPHSPKKSEPVFGRRVCHVWASRNVRSCKHAGRRICGARVVVVDSNLGRSGPCCNCGSVNATSWTPSLLADLLLLMNRGSAQAG